MRSDFCHTCFVDLARGEICPQCGEDQSWADAPGDVLRPSCVLGGKYKIGRLLGRGGFGATYLAWDMNLRIRIAIKEFLPRQLAARTSGGTHVSPYTGGQDAFNIGLQQFLGEARNLAQFRDHPGIISVLDFFPENGTGYMVMEYLAGRTLEQQVTAEGRLDFKVALRLLTPVADALRACHAARLIHRDISPDNIFLTSDGRVKLLDFGAARIAIGSQSTNLSVILKEGYAPFEQYQRNGRQGPWTDIYALTATLYRLLTGALPVTAPDRVAGMRLPPPSEKGVKIPASLQALLDKGMAIQSEQRYQTIDAFLSDLQAVLRTSGESLSSTNALQSPFVSPSTTRRVSAIPPTRKILAGAVVLLVAGSVAFWAITDRAPVLPPERPNTAVLPATPLPDDAGRQAIASALSNVPCSFVTGDDRREGLSALRGIVGRGQSEVVLHGAIHNAAPNTAIEWQVAPADLRYCAVLDVIRPYAQPFGGSGKALDIALADGRTDLVADELVTPRANMPDFAGTLQLDYFTNNGNVQHMHDSVGASLYDARSSPLFGEPNPPDFGGWAVDEPFGTDLIVGIASSVPLFSTARPELDELDAYLRDLRVALNQAARDGARISAAVLLVRTSPKH